METLKTTNERTISVSRELAYDREIVFNAFLADDIVKWWGPKGFTTTTHSREVKEGGHWIHTMHGPDGTDYDNCTKYLEIKRPELLKYQNGAKHDENHLFVNTITFEETESGTLVTLNMEFITKESKIDAAKHGAIEGGHDTLSRLEDYLNKG